MVTAGALSELAVEDRRQVVVVLLHVDVEVLVVGLRTGLREVLLGRYHLDSAL